MNTFLHSNKYLQPVDTIDSVTDTHSPLKDQADGNLFTCAADELFSMRGMFS